jgi:hypothetical protein
MEAQMLDSPEKIMERLAETEKEPHARERLHPKIARLGGTMKVPEGVVLGVLLAENDYCEGMPPMLGKLVGFGTDKRIKAVCGDNEALVAAALEHYGATCGAANKAAERKA